MSSYSNYLGSKKCCSTNLAKNITGSQGYQGSPGPIGPYGNQGATGSQGIRGATGPCCRGPPGTTGVQGPTGAKGADGAAGGNGGLPFFLNYSVDHNGSPITIPTYPPNTNTGPLPPGNNPFSGNYIPALQSIESLVASPNGIVVQYPNGASTTQDFITTLSYSGTQQIPAGFYTLYLYAYNTANPSDWSVNIQIYVCNSITGATIGSPILTSGTYDVTEVSALPGYTPIPLVIPHQGTSTIIDSSQNHQLLLRLNLIYNGGGSDLIIHSEFKGSSEGYSLLQTTFAPPGATGVQGSTGNIGNTGPIGSTGVQGSTGPTGTQGATGTTGAQGNTGPTGAQGATGYQGATGAQGRTGAQGSTGPVGPVGAGGALGYYGSFGNTAGFTASSINTVQNVYIGYVDGTGNNGINLGGTAPYTYLLIDNPGVYNVQFSGQIDKSSGAGGATLNIWIEKDSGSGFVAIPASNTALNIPSNNQPHVAAWNWFIKTTTNNEKIRLMWETDNLNITWSNGTQLAGSPTIPSLILTVQQVMNTQVGPTGVQGVTGITGPQGATGAIGFTGSRGATGITGAQGATGTIGATGVTGAQGATGPSQWVNMNAQGPQGAGYTGIGVTGQDVLIYGNLLVTGAIDPTSLSLSQSTSGPQGSIWYDTNDFVRMDQMKIDDSTCNLTFQIDSTGSPHFPQINLSDSAVNNYCNLSNKRINIFDGTNNGAYIDLNAQTAGIPYIELFSYNTTPNTSISIHSDFITINNDNNGTPYDTYLLADQLKFRDNSNNRTFQFQYYDTTIPAYTTIFEYELNTITIADGKRLVFYDGALTSSSLTITGGTNRLISNISNVTGKDSLNISTGDNTYNLTLNGGRGGPSGNFNSGGTTINSGQGNCNFGVYNGVNLINSFTVNTDGFQIYPTLPAINWQSGGPNALNLGTSSSQTFFVSLLSSPGTNTISFNSTGVNGGSYTVIIRYQSSGTVSILANDFVAGIYTNGFPLSLANGSEFILLRVVYDTTFGPNYYVSGQKFT